MNIDSLIEKVNVSIKCLMEGKKTPYCAKESEYEKEILRHMHDMLDRGKDDIAASLAIRLIEIDWDYKDKMVEIFLQNPNRALQFAMGVRGFYPNWPRRRILTDEELEKFQSVACQDPCCADCFTIVYGADIDFCKKHFTKEDIKSCFSKNNSEISAENFFTLSDYIKSCKSFDEVDVEKVERAISEFLEIYSYIKPANKGIPPYKLRSENQPPNSFTASVPLTFIRDRLIGLKLRSAGSCNKDNSSLTDIVG